MDELKRIWPEWEVVAVLGHGSYGSVLKARRKLEGYEDIYAAIKIITIPHNTNEIRELQSTGMSHEDMRVYYQDIVQKMTAEIAIMQSLKSANEIVTIDDFQIVEDARHLSWRIYIRMELLSGLPAGNGASALTQKDVVRMAKDILRGLIKCEEKGIIHRDIKPANILVDAFGTYKLADFGIARQMNAAMDAATKAGTMNYMAPEVYRGESYDQTVDLYALGIVMYQLLNRGRLPFLPDDPQPFTADDYNRAQMMRLQGAMMKAPVDCDDALAHVILKACAYHPQARYQTAEQMLRDLEGDSDRATSRTKKSKTLWLILPVIIVGMCLAGIAGYVLLWREPPLYDDAVAVDLFSRVTLAYEQDDDGTYRVNVANSVFKTASPQGNEKAKAFCESIQANDYHFSKAEKLHAGDTIRVYVEISNRVLNRYHVKLEKTSTYVQVTTSSDGNLIDMVHDADFIIFPQAATEVLSEKDLARLTNATLCRVAANEILARRGYIFNTSGLDTYFRQKNWYQALSREVDLTLVEQTNQKKIEAYAQAHGMTWDKEANDLNENELYITP